MFPYIITGVPKIITRTGGDAVIGRSLVVYSHSGATVIVTGDYSTKPLWLGQQYTFEYEFSEQTMRERATGSGSPATIGNGRLQMRRLYLRYANSAYFRVEVTPLYRDTSSVVFNGRVVGSGDNVIDAVPLASGVRKIPIHSRADRVVIKIVNDSHLPSRFQSADWDANFTIRSQRV